MKYILLILCSFTILSFVNAQEAIWLSLNHKSPLDKKGIVYNEPGLGIEIGIMKTFNRISANSYSSIEYSSWKPPQDTYVQEKDGQLFCESSYGKISMVHFNTTFCYPIELSQKLELNLGLQFGYTFSWYKYEDFGQRGANSSVQEGTQKLGMYKLGGRAALSYNINDIFKLRYVFKYSILQNESSSVIDDTYLNIITNGLGLVYYL